MLISSAKRKDRVLAVEIKAMILSAFQSLSHDDVIVTPSSVPGPDLMLSPAAQLVFPVVVEMKNQQTISIWAALKQAESHAKNGLTPLLFFRRNHHAAYVCLKASDFFDRFQPKR